MIRWIIKIVCFLSKKKKNSKTYCYFHLKLKSNRCEHELLLPVWGIICNSEEFLRYPRSSVATYTVRYMLMENRWIRGYRFPVILGTSYLSRYKISNYILYWLLLLWLLRLCATAATASESHRVTVYLFLSLSIYLTTVLTTFF